MITVSLFYLANSNSNNKGSTMVTEPEIVTTNRFNIFKKKQTSTSTDRKGSKSPNIVNIKNNVEKVYIHYIGKHRRQC